MPIPASPSSTSCATTRLSPTGPCRIVRCPDGYPGECFFQKHEMRGMPASIRNVAIAENGAAETSLYISDLAGLVGLVQIGVLEIHPWGSTVQRIEAPDRLVFDLDPDVGLAWERVVEGALAVKALLDGLGLASFVKTTGG